MTSSLFSARKSRLFACTFGALAISTILTAAMPAYLPFDQGDSIAGPILLFPFTWLALFLFSLITSNIWHVWSGLAVLGSSHALIIYLAINPS